MSVQREGTSWKPPRTLVGPPTCHLCVSECWYPGPLTVIVHDADPDQPDDGAARLGRGWSVAAEVAATPSAVTTSRGRRTSGVLHSDRIEYASPRLLTGSMNRA